MTFRIPVLFFAFCLLATLNLSAQSSGLRETAASFDGRQMNALSLSLQAGVDPVQEYWEDYWEARYDADFDRIDRDKRSSTYRAEELQIPVVKAEPVTVFVKFSEQGEQRTVLEMAIALDEEKAMGAGQSDGNWSAVRELLTDFERSFYQNWYGGQIAEVREELAELREDRADELADREKELKRIRKWEEQIAKLQRKIADARADIGDSRLTEEEKKARIDELEARLRRLEPLLQNWQ